MPDLNGKLVLEDGKEFYGQLVGPYIEKVGKIAHYAASSGYQEILTDPAAYGQTVVMQYPFVGNYGINRGDYEAIQPHVSHLVTKEITQCPHHYKMRKSLLSYMQRMSIPGLTRVDVRSLLQYTKEHGTQKAIIVRADVPTVDALESIKNATFKPSDMKFISTPIMYEIPGNGPRLAVLDLGLKQSLLKKLNQSGYQVTILPWDTDWEEIEDLDVDAVLISSGPFQSEVVETVVKAIKPHVTEKPLFGVGLGCLVLCEATGLGMNPIDPFLCGTQMVRRVEDRKLFQATMNLEALPELNGNQDYKVTHELVNLPGIVGLKHRRLPIAMIAFYPEGSPGPECGQEFFETMALLLRKDEENAKEN